MVTVTPKKEENEAYYKIIFNFSDSTDFAISSSENIITLSTTEFGLKDLVLFLGGVSCVEERLLTAFSVNGEGIISDVNEVRKVIYISGFKGLVKQKFTINKTDSSTVFYKYGPFENKDSYLYVVEKNSFEKQDYSVYFTKLNKKKNRLENHNHSFIGGLSSNSIIASSNSEDNIYYITKDLPEINKNWNANTKTVIQFSNRSVNGYCFKLESQKRSRTYYIAPYSKIAVGYYELFEYVVNSTLGLVTDTILFYNLDEDLGCRYRYVIDSQVVDSNALVASNKLTISEDSSFYVAEGSFNIELTEKDGSFWSEDTYSTTTETPSMLLTSTEIPNNVSIKMLSSGEGSYNITYDLPKNPPTTTLAPTTTTTTTTEIPPSSTPSKGIISGLSI